MAIEKLTVEELLKLTNDAKRKAFLDKWPMWAIWGECEPLGLTVRRIELPDGSFISAAEYDEYSMNYNGRHAILNYRRKIDGFTPHSETTNQIADRLKDLKEQFKRNK